MLELTDYDTGEPVYVVAAAILSMRQLTAEQYEDDDEPQEVGRRTRIDTSSDMFLVREDAKGIKAMIDSVGVGG